MVLITLLDVFISRRCYTEKKADVTQIFLRNICENASVLHLREKCPVVSVLTFKVLKYLNGNALGTSVICPASKQPVSKRVV